MTTNKKVTGAVLTMLGIALLTFVYDGQRESEVATVVEPVVAVIEVPENKSTLTEISPRSKPGAGISLTYQLPKQLSPGQVVEVAFTLTSAFDNGELEVDVQAEDIEILNQPQHFLFNLSDSAEHQLTLSVFSPEAGLGFINLFISQRNEQGESTSQVYSIPLQFGAEISQQLNDESSTLEENQDGIRIMSVQETISTDE